MLKRKRNALFLCTGNSCRSQMAEGWLRHLAGDRFEPFSAGLEPKDAVHPLALKAMAEVGIDISGQKPKDLKQYLGRESILVLFVVCDKAKNACPRIWPGLPEENRFYWPLDDPAEATGDEESQMPVFRRVRDEIKTKLEQWLKDNET
ncbi:MAG: arsenate reductase ArsC [bacterium]|nr:arsenate reductase ArsC [bacterium]